MVLKPEPTPVEITFTLLNDVALHYRSNTRKDNTQRVQMMLLASTMNHWLPQYDINTRLRVAHFLAQTCHETAHFLSLTEKPARGGLEYEPTTRAGRNLGNEKTGDGPKYIGRGLLHLTGRENYKKYGRQLTENLVDYPETVALPFSDNEAFKLAVRTACLFWKNNDINIPADNDDLMEVTHRVNGGYNGLEARRRALDRAKRSLGIGI